VAEAEGGSSAQRGRLADLDTSVAHPARVYDYWLGGKDNFAADREAAERVLAAAPGLRYRVRANRAFLGRATRYLAAEAGVRQFLDIGTGIPTADNTHEVAQRAAPDSRVVYVDNDPIVLLHAQALLRSTPEGATDYLQADLRDPGTILDRAAAHLDFGQPVALMLLGVLHLIQDAEDPWGIVVRLMAALPPGSPRRRPCAPGSRWPGSSPASSWWSRDWCKYTSGVPIRATPSPRGPSPRTARWAASPVPSRPGYGNPAVSSSAPGTRAR